MVINRVKCLLKNNFTLYLLSKTLYQVAYCAVYYLYVGLKKLCTCNRVIFSENYVKYELGKVKKNNWGDDLNIFLWEYVTSMEMVSIPYSKLVIKKFDCYSLIGSIISFYNLDNKIIYGSGLMSPYDSIKGIPKRIYSVRGPLTREYLVKAGIECPEKYGDPALLLPLFYVPHCKEKKNGSVILNMGTNPDDSDCFHELCVKLNLNVISMVDYDEWTDVIDEIVNSQFVISESLHGLIIAETYGVPNVWVEFKEHPDYWNFKFYDYFSSISKRQEIIHLQKGIPYNEIDFKIKNWKKAVVDYKKMFSYLPFEVKCPINKDFLGD